MYNNKQVWKVLSKISAETCLKMGYFGSKFQKSPSTGGSAPDPLPPADRGFAPRPPFRLND